MPYCYPTPAPYRDTLKLIRKKRGTVCLHLLSEVLRKPEKLDTMTAAPRIRVRAIMQSLVFL